MILLWLKSNLKYIVAGLIVIALLSCGFIFKRMLDSRDERIAELATQLASSEETIEIKEGLFATATHEVANLRSVIENMKTTHGKEIDSLMRQVQEANQKILSLNNLVIKWKKAYEGAVAASQEEVPPTEPGGVVRKKVTFTKDFGPIGVSGYTLTDPPEGFVKVEQLRALELTLAIALNKNRTWSTYVTSSDPNMDVKIALSGIDLSILEKSWYQKIWVTGGIDFYGDKGGSVGLSYAADRWSLGPTCRAGENGWGCGLTAGYRIFK